MMSINSRDLQIEICPDVYPPAEDTYLTCRAVSLLFKVLRLHERYFWLEIIEVGSGTGILTIHIAKECQTYKTKCRIISTDLQISAAKCTLANVKLNDVDSIVDIIVCDKLSCIKESYKPTILISNPPYLPEDTVDICNPSYCGGPDGRTVIDHLILYSIEKKVILLLTQSSLSNYSMSFEMLLKSNCDVLLLGIYHIFFEDIVTFLGVCYG